MHLFVEAEQPVTIATDSTIAAIADRCRITIGRIRQSMTGCGPSQDQRGIGNPSGTSAADIAYADIDVVVAHAK